MCVCANFLAKQTALTFSAQICPKMDLRLVSQKNIVAIRISILDIPCVPIFSQNEQRRIFRSKFVQKKDLGLETEKSNVRTKINIVETLCVPISAKLDNFDFFGPNFAKNGFKEGNSEN